MHERRSAVSESKLDPSRGRIERSNALSIAQIFIEELGLKYLDPSSVTVDSEFTPMVAVPVGSIRRGRSDVGDVDIVVTEQISTDDVSVIEGVSNVSGSTKRIDFDYMDRRVNIWVCTDPNAYGACLLASTGPQMYNIRVRAAAKRRGFKLSEKGLFDEKGQRIAGRTEESVQEALGITVRNPDER